MLSVWSDAATIRHAPAFEAALAEAQGAEGLMAADVATRIVAAVRALTIDTVVLADETVLAGTLAISLVRHLRAAAGDDGGQVQLGATSQDVADAVLVLQLCAAATLLIADAARITRALKALLWPMRIVRRWGGRCCRMRCRSASACGPPLHARRTATGRGGSSAMAHKRNPIGCQVTPAAATRAPGLVAGILAAMVGEEERGLGGWQAEGPMLADLALIASGALAPMAVVAEGLEIGEAAIARNLASAGIGDDIGESVALVAALLREDG